MVTPREVTQEGQEYITSSPCKLIILEVQNDNTIQISYNLSIPRYDT